MFYDLDGVDFGQLDGLPGLLESLIPEVGKTMVQDDEVPPLPDRDEPRRLLLEIAPGLVRLANNLLI